LHFRMPSSQSVARNARRLATSRSRLTIGAAAASVATVAAVAAASSGPATSMTGQLTADTLRTPAFSAYPTDASSPLASAAATAGESAVQGIAPGVAGHSQAGGSPRVTSAQPTPAASATMAPVPPHPRVHEAIEALHSARDHMQHAEGEFHGHRDKAIEHIDAALHEADICDHEP